MVIVSDDDEPAPIDTKEEKREEAPNPVKEEKTEAAPDPVERQINPDDESTDDESTEDEPESPKDGVNEPPVAQAVKNQAVPVGAEVNVSVATNIYVGSSKPPRVKPFVSRLEPISEEETPNSSEEEKPKPPSKSEGVSRYQRVDTEDDDEYEQAGDDAPAWEGGAGGWSPAGDGGAGWSPGGDGGAGGGPGEGGAGGSFQPTDAGLDSSRISGMNRLAVDDNAVIEVDLAEKNIAQAHLDLQNPDLTSQDRKNIKAKIKRAHESISKLLSKTIDPTTIVPNGSNRVTEQLDFFFGGSLVGFGIHCQSVFKGGRPDSENSELVKAPTVPKVTSRNPGHAAGAQSLA